MDEVKKIEHYKNLNTDTSENSAADLDSFLKKNKKNKEMSEIVADPFSSYYVRLRIANSLRLGKRMGK